MKRNLLSTQRFGLRPAVPLWSYIALHNKTWGGVRIKFYQAGGVSMVQLVMTFCLIANHASCIVQRPMLDDMAGPMSCLTSAQPMAAEFLNGHPEYVLQSWRCQIGQRSGRSA